MAFFNEFWRGTLLLAAIHGAYAQQAAPTVWIESKTAPACRAGGGNAAREGLVAGQLREAGVPVGRVHSATLTVDTDCVAVGKPGRNAALAVHQCLDLSQGASLGGQARPAMVSTWRNCQSYTCETARCEAQISSRLHVQVASFLGEFHNLNASPVIKEAPKPARSAAKYPSKSEFSAVVPYYLAYIMACLAVLARWEYTRHRLYR